MQPQVEAFFHEPTNTASYVVRDGQSNICAIIDPVLDFDAASGRTSTASAAEIAAFAEGQGLRCEWILETHAHADHLSAAPYLKERLGGKIGIGFNITAVQTVFGKIFNAGPEFQRDGSQFDALFGDGTEIVLGSLRGRAIHTPGHTPACMTYIFGGAAFIGDTLFMPDYGTARCDFPGGDARELYRSVQKLYALPPQTRLFVCHDYLPPGRTQYRWETTVAEQKARNIQIHEGITEEEFVKMRKARDATLNMPALILPSVQVNMRAGHLPPAEDNGINYLKLPVDLF
ncbi:MAG: MBL fold metallo-hydrolase [Beijerinckiaceae bacterium]|nr:MBL fold metallo-hydrolase [Beijerinckiaceae bacterium]